jgi:hypothetical protein
VLSPFGCWTRCRYSYLLYTERQLVRAPYCPITPLRFYVDVNESLAARIANTSDQDGRRGPDCCSFPVVESLAPLISSHKIIAGSPSVNGMLAIRPTTSS